MGSSSNNKWLVFVVVHVLFMGFWGALIEIPQNAGFPPTLGYAVWALTMIPAALIALKINNWQLDTDWNSAFWGSLAGLLGAIGQLVLFQTLKIAPAYLVFPILSLTPVVTILLAVTFLGETTSKQGWTGIGLALVAILLLSYQSPSEAVEGYSWLIWTAIPLLAWGGQGFVMRFANESMKAESIFFYMMVSSVVLMPIALFMTDFSQPINWGWNGPYLTAAIQILNAFGALCLVYAFRYGKAIVIAPITTALSPVITVILSLIIYSVVPHIIIVAGMIVAIIATFLLGMEEETENIAEQQHAEVKSV